MVPFQITNNMLRQKESLRTIKQRGKINIHTTQETDRQTNNIDQAHVQFEVRGYSTHLQHTFKRIRNVDPSVQSYF